MTDYLFQFHLLTSARYKNNLVVLDRFQSKDGRNRKIFVQISSSMTFFLNVGSPKESIF